VPEAVVIAGANGAGKTTFARELLPALYPELEFLNVDEVQTEGSIFAHPVAAGREVLRRLADAERRCDSFGWRSLGTRTGHKTPVSPGFDAIRGCLQTARR
jgi:predicted ABC-type ATPase